MWDINSTANKPPASCRGLELLMWTDIEAGSLAVELGEVERTTGGEKSPGITRRPVFTGEATWLDVWVPAGPKSVADVAFIV